MEEEEGGGRKRVGTEEERSWRTEVRDCQAWRAEHLRHYGPENFNASCCPRAERPRAQAHTLVLPEHPNAGGVLGSCYANGCHLLLLTALRNWRWPELLGCWDHWWLNSKLLALPVQPSGTQDSQWPNCIFLHTKSPYPGRSEEPWEDDWVPLSIRSGADGIGYRCLPPKHEDLSGNP